MDVIDTYTLKHPLTVTIKNHGDGSERQELITEVTFRKPLTGDLLAMDGKDGDRAGVFAFIAAISNLSYHQIIRLEIEDGRALLRKANGFLSGGRETGDPASAD
jgi:hypothetical protein